MSDGPDAIAAAPAAGERVPAELAAAELHDGDGRARPLGSLWRARPVLLLWVRHFG